MSARPVENARDKYIIKNLLWGDIGYKTYQINICTKVFSWLFQCLSFSSLLDPDLDSEEPNINQNSWSPGTAVYLFLIWAVRAGVYSSPQHDDREIPPAARRLERDVRRRNWATLLLVSKIFAIQFCGSGSVRICIILPDPADLDRYQFQAHVLITISQKILICCLKYLTLWHLCHWWERK